MTAARSHKPLPLQITRVRRQTLGCHGAPPTGCRQSCIASSSRSLVRQVRDLSGVTGEFEDVHSGVSAIDDIDVAAIVDFDVVCLDRHFAALLTIVELNASLVCVFGGCRNVIGYLGRVVGITQNPAERRPQGGLHAAPIRQRRARNLEHQVLVADQRHILGRRGVLRESRSGRQPKCSAQQVPTKGETL